MQFQRPRLVVTMTTADGRSRRSIKETVNESTNVLLSVFHVFVRIARERNVLIALQKRSVIGHYELLVVLTQCVPKFCVRDRKRLLDAVDLLHFTIEALWKTSGNYRQPITLFIILVFHNECIDEVVKVSFIMQPKSLLS